jgi:hypothetical protein
MEESPRIDGKPSWLVWRGGLAIGGTIELLVGVTDVYVITHRMNTSMSSNM